jgi:hypothetical protein
MPSRIKSQMRSTGSIMLFPYYPLKSAMGAMQRQAEPEVIVTV